MTNGDLGTRPARPDRTRATQNGMTLQTGLAVNGHICLQQGLLRLVGCRDPKVRDVDGRKVTTSDSAAPSPIKLAV